MLQAKKRKVRKLFSAEEPWTANWQKIHLHLGSGARKRKGDWWLIDSRRKIVMEKSTGDAIFQNWFSAGEPSRSFRATILILKSARALHSRI